MSYSPTDSTASTRSVIAELKQRQSKAYPAYVTPFLCAALNSS